MTKHPDKFPEGKYTIDELKKDYFRIKEIIDEFHEFVGKYGEQDTRYYYTTQSNIQKEIGRLTLSNKGDVQK